MVFFSFTNSFHSMIKGFFSTGCCFSDHEGGNVSAHAGHLVCIATWSYHQVNLNLVLLHDSVPLLG